MNSRFNFNIPTTQNNINGPLFLQEEKLREELLIQKLESKLGKSRREVKSMLSDGLLSTLTKVPFTL